MNQPTQGNPNKGTQQPNKPSNPNNPNNPGQSGQQTQQGNRPGQGSYNTPGQGDRSGHSAPADKR